MAISDRLTSMSEHIRSAYNTAMDKGATIPSNRNLENLSNTINSIPTGTTPVKKDDWKDFNFIDYDGTLLYSYTKEEFTELGEMPPLPTHEEFKNEEWNWDYNEAVEEDYCIIGVNCATKDDKTRITFEIPDDNFKIYLGVVQSKSRGLQIDWGDGSLYETSTTYGTTGSSMMKAPHIYSKGKYTIELTTLIEGTEVRLVGTSGKGSNIIYQSDITNAWLNNFKLHSLVTKLELAQNVILGDYVFYNLTHLNKVNVPAATKRMMSSELGRNNGLKAYVYPKIYSDGNQGVGQYSFAYSPVEVVSIPRKVPIIGGYFAQYSMLKHINIPKSVYQISSYAFRNAQALSDIKLPNGMRTIQTYAFYQAYSLNGIIKIGAGVTNIPGNTFYQCPSVKAYDFTDHTSVPSLTATNAFQGILSEQHIIVPDNLYDEWIEATNWSSSSIKSRIVKASEYYG